MQKLSLKKTLLIVRLYFDGLAYGEIAVRAGVGKGTVANVISELKAGQFPEAGNLSDHLELLRELAVDLRRTRLTPVQAAVGLSVLSRLQQLGVEPGDIEGCAALGHALTTGDADVQSLVRAAITVDEARKHTGLSVDELENRVKELQEAANRLEPLAKKVADYEKQLADLDISRQGLRDEVSSLENRTQTLNRNIADKERREAELSSRVSDLEEKAYSADERLANARKDLETLSRIGMSLDNLSGFTERLKSIAQRHGISPNALRERLLSDLEQLDKGLGLEIAIQTKQRELRRIEEATLKAQEKLVALQTTNQQLQLEQSSLRAALTEERKRITKEVGAISTMAQNMVAELRQNLGNGVSESLAEVDRVKNRALELGKELGQFEGIIESNNWLKGLLALVKGDDAINANQTRVIGLTVLRGISTYLNRNFGSSGSSYPLKTSITSAVTELERWKV